MRFISVINIDKVQKARIFLVYVVLFTNFAYR